MAVLPVLADGKLGPATDVVQDAGKIGSTTAAHAPPGSYAISGHDRTHAHMIAPDPAGRFVLHVDLGLDKIFVSRFDAEKGKLTADRSAGLSTSPRRWSPSLPFPSQRPLALLDSGGRLDGDALSTTTPPRAG